jgi:alpha-galactosidase
VEGFRIDYEIPMRYGVDNCIGDTMGPGGVFRAQRHIPALLEIAAEMRELCHQVQTTMDLIASYTGVGRGEIDFVAAGIKHMAWFLRLEHRGRDLYPLLKANFEKPGYFANEKVRGEVRYCDEPGFGGESGAYYRYCA